MLDDKVLPVPKVHVLHLDCPGLGPIAVPATVITEIPHCVWWWWWCIRYRYSRVCWPHAAAAGTGRHGGVLESAWWSLPSEEREIEKKRKRER